MILQKKIYQKIEHYLYSQFETAEQLEIIEEDIIHGCKSRHLGEETGGGIANSNESKVENAAIKLINLHESEDSKWVEVIKSVLKEFEDTEYEKLIDYTYNKQFRVTKILRLLNIEKSSYYDKRNDVIIQVALKAAYNGLIDNRIKNSSGKIVVEKK